MILFEPVVSTPRGLAPDADWAVKICLALAPPYVGWSLAENELINSRPNGSRLISGTTSRSYFRLMGCTLTTLIEVFILLGRSCRSLIQHNPLHVYAADSLHLIGSKSSPCLFSLSWSISYFYSSCTLPLKSICQSPDVTDRLLTAARNHKEFSANWWTKRRSGIP